MKQNDLFRMCIQNLFRHRGRTLLTVLGVVVGCCSVIIMVSIGIGMKESQEKMLAEMGDLTIISVLPAGKGQKAAKLDDPAVKKMQQLPNVEIASPKVTAENISLQLYAGKGRRYVCEYTEVVGLYPDALDKLGYKLEEGALLPPKAYTVLVGQDFAYMFADSKRPKGRNMIDSWPDEAGEKKAPYFDPMKIPLELEITLESGGTKKITQPLEVSGRMKEDYGKGYETSQGLIMSVKDLNQLLEQQRRAAGKPAKKMEYKTVLVKVNDIRDVEATEEAIKNMGFRTSSMESIRKPMEKEARQKQMMLGGLGGISLLVAALGIANTMMMSITERTREIGIMKSLGCFVRDVRTIFLLEAGFIGLFGGIIGIAVSGVVSFIMNISASQIPITSLAEAIAALFIKGNRMSVIPLWLVLFALVFSILIGIGSGYYPANKAVRIPALEAIKHD